MHSNYFSRISLTAASTILFFSGCAAQTELPEAEICVENISTNTEITTQTETVSAATTVSTDHTTEATLQSSDDINLHDEAGDDKHYVFTYHETDFHAIYTPDHWKIEDSFQITNSADMKLICEALISVHPVHAANLSDYRTAADMAYEWAQHNLAYQFLSDDSPYKSHAKDVDLDPKDQGKSMYEIFLDRTGQNTG